jgi:hypothetical protein
MDKLVKRVTVVEGAGDKRQAKVVYESEKDEEEKGVPALGSIERAVRHLLKADLIRAQEAYDRHVESATKGEGDWLFAAPANIIKAFRKAEGEARKAAQSLRDEDEEKGH